MKRHPREKKVLLGDKKIKIVNDDWRQIKSRTQPWKPGEPKPCSSQRDTES